MQRTEEPGETQENLEQDSNHSIEDLSASSSGIHMQTQTTPRNIAQPAKERLQWPKMNENREWANFEEDMDIILDTALAGTAEKKVDAISAIVYNLAKERFGIQAKSSRFGGQRSR